ncbi:ABC transporter substrate-binding protein [Yinghuangia seranimata]|uniref:ABC transporter substrate-binding protein n=1 Tax=Yinghuangia seranimata TaxID=408067 RepID=UPI00248CDE03|nr:iron-siderophore ABC transporter substrate-binding protein [Yinghuangia seranimata]MDI2127197.1 iron-siderophore ABC transporter substrate-binding protein [Yinghuangia seranimata]
MRREPGRLNRHRRAFAAVAAAVALTLDVAGCGSDDEKSDAAKPAAASAQASGGGSNTAATFPRTVTHDKGTTEIKAKPKRVVALDNSLVEAVALLDEPLVGGISAYRDQKGFPSYLGPAVKDTKEVGPLDSPNLEQILALKPDLIVSATVRHDQLYGQLSKIAPTVFVKTTGPIWKDNIKLIAQALGDEDKAAAKLSAYEARAKKIGTAVNAKANNPTVSVVRFVDGPTRIYLPKTFSGIVLADAGIARPENQRDPEKFNIEISEEQIGLADADYVFVTAFSGGADRKAKFLANPLWQRLKAVQGRHVVEVEDPIWMTSVSLQGAEMILDDLAKAFAVDPAK